MLRRCDLRAEKVRYPDGVGCCIWYVHPGVQPGDEREDSGFCWDFAADDLDDIIALLQELRDTPAEEYEGE